MSLCWFEQYPTTDLYYESEGKKNNSYGCIVSLPILIPTSFLSFSSFDTFAYLHKVQVVKHTKETSKFTWPPDDLVEGGRVDELWEIVDD